MGDPYVNSGESFIRTTGRVSVNFALYDMILTTRHLILVDNTYARFEPQMIPVLTILSVTAGKVATGEPVITLSFVMTGSTGTPVPMNLIFMQEPGEQRKRERDEWIKILIDHIVAARQQTVSAAAPAHQKQGSLPKGATPRPIELAFPHKTSAGSDPFPSEIVILPDEVESPSVEEGTSLPSPTQTSPAPVREEAPDSPEAQEQALPPKIHEPTVPASPEVITETGTLQTPATEEPVPRLKEETGTFVKPFPAVEEPGEPKEQPATTIEAEILPQAPAVPPSRPGPLPGWLTAITVSVLVIIILAVVGGMFLYLQNGPGTGGGRQIPAVTTAPALPYTPAPLLIPGYGVWVRVQNNGSFIGYVGNPGSLQHVGGSGNRFYYIPKSDGLVQATIQNQDNTGNTLTIEVYRNGEMVFHRSTRVPGGEVQILIDPKTGNPPGVNATAATK
jgi:hypothetical protein